MHTFMLGFDHSFVVDDFFDDPDEVRSQILSIERFFRGHDANFPGYAGSLPDALRQMIIDRVEKAIGYNIKPCTSRDMDLSARISIRGDEKFARSLVHCDPHPFTAIIYLTPDDLIPPGINYGTRIYETRKHDINTVVYDKLKPSLKARWSKEEFAPIADECREQTFNLLYWKMIHYVDFKFNRLCIFSGPQFHSACPAYFGETQEEGRLTINFFFELKKKDR